MHFNTFFVVGLAAIITIATAAPVAGGLKDRAPTPLDSLREDLASYPEDLASYEPVDRASYLPQGEGNVEKRRAAKQ